MQSKEIDTIVSSALEIIICINLLVWIGFMLVAYCPAVIEMFPEFSQFLLNNQFWIWFPLWVLPAGICVLFILTFIIGCFIGFNKFND